MKSRLIVATIYVHNESSNTYSSKDLRTAISFTHFSKFRKWYKKYSNILDLNIKSHESSDSVFMIHFKDHSYGSCRIEIEKHIPKSPTVETIIDQFYIIMAREETFFRLKHGYVYTCREYMEPKDYHGSFSLDFITPNKQYIENHPCGYFGHTNRMHWMDKIIESTVNDIPDLTQNEKCEWLTSTSARHWMDNVDPINKIEFAKSWKNTQKIIKEDIERWNKNK